MRMPEKLERQYVADSLVAAGVLVPTGQGETPDLPPPELPAKIPIPLAEYGFQADVCDNCGHIETAYNSCRNRHCPKCQ